MIRLTSISLRNASEWIEFHIMIMIIYMPWNVLIGVLNFQKCWKPLTILKVNQFLVSGTGVQCMYLYYQINTTCIHRYNKVFANLIKNTDNGKPLYLPDVPHSQYHMIKHHSINPSGLLLKVNVLSLSKSLCNRIKNCPMFT